MINEREFNKLPTMERFELLHLMGEFNCIANEYKGIYDYLKSKNTYSPLIESLREHADFTHVRNMADNMAINDISFTIGED